MRIKSIQKETVRTENSTEQKSLLNVFLTKPSGKCIQQIKKLYYWIVSTYDQM